MKQCPVCGGLIHPIAGRCKHCKADLVKLEAAAARVRAPQPRPGSQPSSPAERAAQVVALPSGAEKSAKHGSRWGQTLPPDAPTQRPSPPPALLYQQPSAWSRRWPYVVGGIALLAIGISLGVLASGSDSGDEETSEKQASPSRTPHMVPDNMPQPDVQTPRMPADPRGSLPPQGWPTPPSSPLSSPGDAPEAGLFGVALTDTVCAKLTDCGMLDDFSKMMCRELAQQLEDPDAEGKVSRGECHYDKTAAAACLDAIRGLDCSSQSADVTAWITQASSLIECASAWICY